jgi:hypothetical protein
MEIVGIAYGYCPRCYHPCLRLSTGHEWFAHDPACEREEDAVPCETAGEEMIIGDLIVDFIRPILN